MNLEHVNLTVSDLDRSIRFYCELLGLTVRWRRDASDDLPAAAHVGAEDWYIAFFEATTPGPMPAKSYNKTGFNHLGIVVDDLDSTRERLIEMGITVHMEADYEPGRRSYFRDHDGIEVELVEYERVLS